MMRALLLPLIGLAQAAAAPPTVPLSLGEPMFAYLNCLMQPVENFARIPTSIAQREAMYGSILERCRDTRTTSAAEAERLFAAEARSAQAADRAEVVNTFFSYWEQQLHFMIVQNERFVAQGDAYEACLESGQPESC